MKLCYIDESGCLGGLPSSTSDITPAFILSALFVDSASLRSLTSQFLDVKKNTYCKYSGLRWHDCMRTEIKGSSLRRDIRSGDRATRRLTTNYLKNILGLLRQHNVRYVSRIFIKGIGAQLDGRAVYTSSMQWVCEQFQHYLAQSSDKGLIVADAREKTQNSIVSHSIFTRKFGRHDAYPDIIEMPTFGHAENHAGLQIADVLCSALLFPLAVYSYCTGFIANCHVSPKYQILKTMFGGTLLDLQYSYLKDMGKMGGGVIVSDPLGHRPSSFFFSVPGQ